MTELVKYDAACRAIAEAKSLDEAKDIRDKSIAMAAYARQAKNKDLEADAVEIRMRAERRLGQMLGEHKRTIGLNEGGRPVKTPDGFVPVIDWELAGHDGGAAIVPIIDDLQQIARLIVRQ